MDYVNLDRRFVDTSRKLSFWKWQWEKVLDNN